MHIAFITANYPTPSRPSVGTFVQQFVWAMARQGHECSVINPASVFDRKYGPYPPRFAVEDAGAKMRVDVHRPRYVSFSSRDLGFIHTGRWTQWSLNHIAVRVVRALPNKPDFVYGHFLYHAGRAATVTGERLGIASVIGVGEGTFWTVDPFGFDRAKTDFEATTGFIAVGAHIRDGLNSEIGVPPEKILLEPNGVDLTKFVPTDQGKARSRLGLAPDRFLIAFVGAFDDLKGGSELVEAVNEMDGVNLAMIGQGGKVFRSPNIIYRGRVSHDQIATWLNAADLFVLPTREEGSCNAVIEALACGLPIVTSDGQYMDDIVDDAVAIRVDPTNVGAIREAILTLKNDPCRRRRMAEACLSKAREFDINVRARRVTAWLNELVKDQHNQRA